MTVVMLLTTPWSWSWWLKIVAWLQSTSCLCAWNTTVKLSSLHNCNLLWIKIRGKQSACICLILSTSLKTFRKARFLARYLRVHALFKRGSSADSGVIYRGPARFWVIIGLSLEGFPTGNYRGNASKSRQRQLEQHCGPMGFFYFLDTGIDCNRQSDRRSR